MRVGSQTAPARIWCDEGLLFDWGFRLSLIHRLASLASDLFEVLEANNEGKVRAFAAIGGVLGTIGIWLVHLGHPSLLFGFHGAVGECIMVLLLAPPFVTGVSIGYLVFPTVNKPIEHASGPMSGYLQRERADKRWKIIVGAGMASAANLLCMILTSRGT
jgi:hypothetical protein